MPHLVRHTFFYVTAQRVRKSLFRILPAFLTPLIKLTFEWVDSPTVSEIQQSMQACKAFKLVPTRQQFYLTTVDIFWRRSSTSSFKFPQLLSIRPLTISTKVQEPSPIKETTAENFPIPDPQFQQIPPRNGSTEAKRTTRRQTFHELNAEKKNIDMDADYSLHPELLGDVLRKLRRTHFARGGGGEGLCTADRVDSVINSLPTRPFFPSITIRSLIR